MIERNTFRDLQDQLGTLETRALEQAGAGRLGPERLQQLADRRAVAGFRLRPVPADPVAHLRISYEVIRHQLEQLDAHQATEAVTITNEDGYTYTFRPRTMLRRVLDHGLDHLNQIEQWIQWRESGIAPKPTDGWASSADTLEEDTLPLSRHDLAAWLWRIDITWHMLAERAAQLAPAELEWTPPGDEWNLARVLHHVSGGFYVAWLDDPLPEDPAARYAEASRRLYQALDWAMAAADDEEVTWFAAGARKTSPECIVAALIDSELSQLEPGSKAT